MSSAHVYVRLNKGQTMDDMSEGLLEDCAQLVKANSIQGWTNYIKNQYCTFVSQVPCFTFACKDAEYFLCTGNKVNNIDVVYTPWYNLKKSPSMDVGQVGFHNPKLVRAHPLLFYSLFLQQDYIHMIFFMF